MKIATRANPVLQNLPSNLKGIVGKKKERRPRNRADVLKELVLNKKKIRKIFAFPQTTTSGHAPGDGEAVLGFVEKEIIEAKPDGLYQLLKYLVSRFTKH